MPDAIIVSVGGGGLICGVIEGLIRNDWIDKEIKVIAVETQGCDCFNKSTKEKKLVTLENITRYFKIYSGLLSSKNRFKNTIAN